jgi:NNP family nitrate/nitrite transporter-like MFS transporter
VTETIVPTDPARRRTGRWIDDWRPEDPGFWAGTGRKVAARNLIVSILTEHVGFSIWSLFSVMVLFMGPAYHLSTADKFLITSTATAVGAVLRRPYNLAVARFGGRNWTIASALLLLVPAALCAVVMHPGTPPGTFVAVAAVTGVGGGNFASSMTNINTFYPQSRKGWALGLNAGGGNLGVAVIMLVALLVLGTAGALQPRVVLWVYLPLIVIGAVCATLFMDNLTTVRNDTRGMRLALRDGHCWVMSLLYVGTFGSFIGYSFAFGLVLQQQFHRTPLQAAALTFIGPLIGSLSRPAGGALADRLGGAAVTLWNFAGMAAGTGVILAASLRHSLPLFLAGFAVVFVLSGAGNGSTYKMIPAVFERRARAEIRAGQRRAAAMAQARRFSGAMLGIVGAVGALGGVAINLAFRQSYAADRSAVPALLGFLGFYALCAAVTYAVYLRSEERAEPARMAEPAGAGYREVGA